MSACIGAAMLVRHGGLAPPGIIASSILPHKCPSFRAASFETCCLPVAWHEAAYTLAVWSIPNSST